MTARRLFGSGRWWTNADAAPGFPSVADIFYWRCVRCLHSRREPFAPFERSRLCTSAALDGYLGAIRACFSVDQDMGDFMPLLGGGVRTLDAYLVVSAIVIAGLVLGRDLLIPLAIAINLAFILSPIVNWLTGAGVPRAVAVVTLLIVLVGSLGAISSIASRQVLALAGEIGTYKYNVMEKVRTIAGASRSDGVLKRASDAVEALEKDVKRELAPTPPAASPDAAVRERVVVKEDNWTSTISNYLSAAAHPLTMAGLTLLLTLFMLLQMRDLRDRIVRIAGTENLSGTTAALGDAAERLSRLFLTQAALNVGFGVTVGVALWLIGLPNAPLWGGIAILMRFVPYVGSLIAAVPPILVAAAVDPGWGMILATIAIFAIGEPLMGHVVEPFVLGSSAGLSPFAMLLSASFWAIVWGPIGLILAAPITIMLVVLGRYIQGLEFMTVLLGDEPALSPEERLYHSLLSGDAMAATMQLEDDATQPSLAGAVDSILTPALRLAAKDFDRGRFDAERLTHFRETTRESIEQSSASIASPAEDPQDRPRAPVMIIPARNQLDHAVADVVAVALRGIPDVAALPHGSQTGLTAISHAAAAAASPEAIIIASAGGADAQYLPLIARRARRSFPSSRIYLFELGSDITGHRIATADDHESALTFGKLRDLLPQLAHATRAPQSVPAVA